MVLQASDISVLTAYVAGFLTFFAPCHWPLVPPYLSFIAGTSLQEAETSLKARSKLVFISLCFVAGFLSVFLMFGLAATWLGAELVMYRRAMQIVGGILMMFVGASLVGLFELNFMAAGKRINVSRTLTKFSWVNAILLGLAFGFSWTPCIGPVLAVILFWATQSHTEAFGISLLFVYGIGLGTPFILLSLFLSRGMAIVKKHVAVLHRLTQMAGIIMIVAGILLIGNWLFILSANFTRFGTPELYFFKVQ